MEKIETIEQNIDDEIDLLDLFVVLWRRKWIIIGITVLAAVFIVLYSIVSLLLAPEKSYLPNTFTPKAHMLIDYSSSGGTKQLLDAGIIERFMDSVEPFISQGSDHITKDLRNEKIWLYPLAAIRETLVNALAHRDWTRFVEIEATLYSDRFEFISPGALPNSMTIEKMKAGQRSPRNTIIMEVLRDYGYVDYRGMGVRTKIIPLTKAMSGREPEFIATDDYLKTILYR